MPRLVLERDEQRKFRHGQSLLFVSKLQRERINHIKENQPIATFAATFAPTLAATLATSSSSQQNSNDVSYPLPKLLGIGSLDKGRFRAERLFVKNVERKKNLPKKNINNVNIEKLKSVRNRSEA